MDNIQFDKISKKLAPLTILYKLILQLPGLVLPLYFGINFNNGMDWFYLVLTLIYGVFVIPGLILGFYYFNFAITNKELIIHSGVINKKQRNIPLNRIQNVNIQESFIQRIFGLAKVQIETAGDSQAEAILDSVTKKDANEIKQIIKEYQLELTQSKVEPIANEVESEEKTERIIEDQNEERLIASLGILDLIKYGFLRFRPLFLIAFGWASSMASQFFPQQFENIDEYVDNNLNQFIPSDNIYISIAYYALFVIVVFLLSWISDVILTIVQYYGFQLKRDKNKLYTDYGMLTKRHNTIPLKKLQMITIYANAIRAKIGYWGLNIETAGGGGNEAKIPEVALPFAKFDKILEIAKDILQFNLPETFKNISKKTINRLFFRYNILLIITSVILYQFFDYWWIILFTTPLFYYLALIRWQNRSYNLDNENIIIKEGWFFKKIKIIPISKIQTLNLRSSIFQRMLGLVTIEIDTAATLNINDASIADIDTEDGKIIFEELSSKFRILG